MQRRVGVERELGAHTEQRVGRARRPLHAHSAVELIRHLLVDGTAEVLAVVTGPTKMLNNLREKVIIRRFHANNTKVDQTIIVCYKIDNNQWCCVKRM